MKPIEIFRTGRHTAMSGTTLAFGEADLAAAVAAYDPALHEAPIVVGHPRGDAPAYGWVASLTASGASLVATPHQLDAAFSEMVAAGRFKKVSAAFYLPDAPGNPKPGSLYLRHVGFLGAQPPAVKGLKQVEFAESQEGIVEFSEDGWTLGAIGRALRSLREFFIAEHGQEKADQALPAWDLETIERSAVVKDVQDRPSGALATFSEPDPATPPAPVDDDAARRAAELDAREQRIAAREAEITAQAIEDRRLADAAFIEGLVKAGKLIPSARPQVLAFMAQLDAEGTVAFAEGAEPVTPAAAFRDVLLRLPKVVHFGEVAPNSTSPVADTSNPLSIARAAGEFQEAQRQKGVVISDIEAVTAVTQGAGS